MRIAVSGMRNILAGTTSRGGITEKRSEKKRQGKHEERGKKEHQGNIN